MRISEIAILEELQKTKIYIDMDGVLANFFAEYAKLAGITSGNYRDVPLDKNDPTLNKMIGTDFFDKLPMFDSAPALINLVLQYVPFYNINTSPLRGDHANSEQHKKVWIQKNLPIQPKELIITDRKWKWAKQSDGTPNILIDDRTKIIQQWQQEGGYGIKFQADEDTLNVVKQGLDSFYFNKEN